MKLGHFIDRASVVEGLKELRRSVCGYLHSDDTPCDCKYGIGCDPDEPKNGEENGCPELRTAIIILEAMSGTEYDYLTGGSPKTDDAALRVIGASSRGDITVMDEFLNSVARHRYKRGERFVVKVTPIKKANGKTTFWIQDQHRLVDIVVEMHELPRCVFVSMVIVGEDDYDFKDKGYFWAELNPVSGEKVKVHFNVDKGIIAAPDDWW
jgi:hypothetical protein